MLLQRISEIHLDNASFCLVLYFALPRVFWLLTNYRCECPHAHIGRVSNYATPAVFHRRKKIALITYCQAFLPRGTFCAV